MPKSKSLNAPAKRLKKPVTVEQYFKLRNYEKLEEHVRVMIDLCYLLGLRISEVLGLRWDDIDFAGRSIVFIRATPFFHLGSHCAEVERWIRTKLSGCRVGEAV